jgi:glycosyltransferase involved in cell wall biosynthesis
MTPELSIIICTRNRASQLERCLESIRRQTLPRGRFETMVVDNGSTDATRAVAGDPGIRYLYEPVAGVSQARNTGWRAAQGQYVGYLDDDATAAPAWAETALAAFQRAKNPPACVSGPIEIQSDTAMPAWINAPLRAYLGEVDLGKTAKDIDDPLASIGGGNLFFQRTILEHMHGFDIRLGRKEKQLRSGEETELLSRIFATGGFIAYHPEVKIIHHIAPERLRPEWFYRLSFGIGHAMGRIKQSTARVQSATPAGMPGLTRAGGRRAAGHLLPALGLSRRRTAIIHGRIYFAFVLGWFFSLQPRPFVTHKNT